MMNQLHLTFIDLSANCPRSASILRLSV